MAGRIVRTHARASCGRDGMAQGCVLLYVFEDTAAK